MQNSVKLFHVRHIFVHCSYKLIIVLEDIFVDIFQHLGSIIRHFMHGVDHFLIDMLNILGRLLTVVGQRIDLTRHNSKSPARFPGSCRFNRSIQG